MNDSVYIAHHGIKGMKWGVRRYQNPDGSLTPEGRKHYYNVSSQSNKSMSDAISRGATIGAIGGGVGAGAIGAVAGAAAGAAAGYAKYRIRKRSFATAQNKLRADNERLDKEYQQSEEYKKWDKKLKGEGVRLDNGGAESFRADRNRSSIASFKSAGYHKSEWARERHLNTPEAVNRYVKKALKNFNEYDPDQIVYQHMGDAILMRDRGYISKNTFQKLYDAQLAEDAFDFSNYGDAEWLDRWYNADKH